MIDNLALAYVTCDKYSHVWDEWYDAFLEHWDIKLPMYVCGEDLECPFVDFKHIPHESVTADHWTSKLRAQIEQIPEDNIFIWLDDLVMQCNISLRFKALYEWFVKHDADSLRIMGRQSKAHYQIADQVNCEHLFKLHQSSPYLISYSPNIYRKEFLLRILQWDESPWSSEIDGTRRIRPWRRNIYAYHIDGWYINKIVQ